MSSSKEISTPTPTQDDINIIPLITSMMITLIIGYVVMKVSDLLLIIDS